MIGSTAQLAFERVMFEHGEELTSTADVLRGVARTRHTLTAGHPLKLSGLPSMLGGVDDEQQAVYKVAKQVVVNVAAGLAGPNVNMDRAET